jgi:hypothetical protein
MRFLTFQDYLNQREGLMLPDKPVLPSGSRINPFPAPASRLKQIMGKRPKSFKRFVNSVENLPSQPGGYVLDHVGGEPYYVGKAHDL